MAKLHFKYGAMNAGKSIDVIRTAHSYEEAGGTVCLMKAAVDTKGGDAVISRVGMERTVDKLIKPETNLYAYIGKRALELDVILIDEAQFLSIEQVEQADQITRDLDIPVIAYGLRTTFQNIGFVGSSRLLELADSLEEVVAMCANGCGHKARRSARVVNGQYVSEGEDIQIDDQQAMKYVALCKMCHHKETGI